MPLQNDLIERLIDGLLAEGRESPVFTPLEWQLPVLEDDSPIVLLAGSAGGGKSKVAATKIHKYMLDNPGSFGVVLRKTRESMGNSTVLFLEREIIRGDPRVQHKAAKHRFEYSNGSILAYGGMNDEKQRESVRSMGTRGGVDIAWFEEANKFSEADFNEVRARMRGTAGPYRQIIVTTNPDGPRHWIYQTLMLGGKAKVYKSRAIDNPYNSPEYLDTLNNLTGILYRRLALGDWVAAEGAIYPTFDPDIHVIDPFEIPAEWPRYMSIDFGYNNPFVCQWWAIDGDGRMYLYREVYMTNKLVQDHAQQILELSNGERIYETWADHDAEDRATLERYGIYTSPAVKDVLPGIEAVQAGLRVQADGRPRIYFFRNALVETDSRLQSPSRPTCTIEELPLYIWQTQKDGAPVKDAPLKTNDHGCDALRYAAMGIQSYRPHGGIWI